MLLSTIDLSYGGCADYLKVDEWVKKFFSIFFLFFARHWENEKVMATKSPSLTFLRGSAVIAVCRNSFFIRVSLTGRAVCLCHLFDAASLGTEERNC